MCHYLLVYNYGKSYQVDNMYMTYYAGTLLRSGKDLFDLHNIAEEPAFYLITLT